MFKKSEYSSNFLLRIGRATPLPYHNNKNSSISVGDAHGWARLWPVCNWVRFPLPLHFSNTSLLEAIMLYAGIYFWFPICIVLSAITVAVCIIMFEKVQEIFLQLNKKKIALAKWNNNIFFSIIKRIYRIKDEYAHCSVHIIAFDVPLCTFQYCKWNHHTCYWIK